MGINEIIMSLLLAALVLAALAAVAVRTLMASTVLLALVSVFMATTLFFSGMAMAGVIELLVSVGLITAILASAIAMLRPTGDDSSIDGKKGKFGWLGRYLPLPIIMLLAAAAILYFVPGIDTVSSVPATPDTTTLSMFWNGRAVDIVGLTFLILAGVLGISTLIRRREGK